MLPQTPIKEGEEMPEHEIPESSPQSAVFGLISPTTKPPSPQISDAMRTYNIPVSSRKDATLLIPGSITIDEYGFIQEWLEKMKNAIVEHEADDRCIVSDNRLIHVLLDRL